MPYVADEFTGRTFGKYEVLCRLTVGGMAEIFLAFARTGPFAFKPVVLKRILTEQREDQSSMQMLIDEAKITATLNHENVARVLDLEIAGDEVLLVIEFISGANLEELVKVVLEKKEVVPLGFVIAAIRDCAQGLHHAHSHKDAQGRPLPIIHRDVTPKNLMIDFEGVGKVLDFGIARAMGAARRTIAGMVRGTSAYMSPEQAIDGKMDIRTDIFSLGTIFHELLTGQRLFYRGNAGKEMAAVYEAEVPPPSQANRRVPKTLDAVVLKALERPLAKRYQSALELVRDLSLAAGSIAWSPDRCAELVRNRFSRRQEEVHKLLLLMVHEQSHGSSTLRGRPTFQQPTAPAKNDAHTDEHGSNDDAAVPTTFFTPNFATPSPDSEPLTWPPSPATGDASANATLINLDPAQSRRLSEQTTSPSERTSTRSKSGKSRRRSARRKARLVLALAAAGALAVGALGGVVLHKAMGSGTAPAAQGVGRLSLEADRPAEVELSANQIVRTPIIDVRLASGMHRFKVREPNGPWLALDVDVKPVGVTKLKVRLDTLQPVP